MEARSLRSQARPQSLGHALNPVTNLEDELQRLLSVLILNTDFLYKMIISNVKFGIYQTFFKMFMYFGPETSFWATKFRKRIQRKTSERNFFFCFVF